MHTRPLWLFAALLLARNAAAVDTPPPLTVPDLVGPRSLALQSGVGAPSGTEALFLNPAALGARKRYTIDTTYLTDRRPELTGPERRQDYFGASVVDSSTTAIAAGLGYYRVQQGVETGSLLRLGLAAPVTSGLLLGLQGNYFDLHGVERTKSSLNLDAGLFYQVSGRVSIGAAGYNLIKSEHTSTEPQGFGVGFAAGADSSLQVTGDWHVDLNRVRREDGSAKRTDRYGAGVEYLFANAVPVRAGFQVDDVSRTKWWSLGLGWVSTRLAIDLGFRQSTDDPTARTIALALRVFVPNE